jgi:predicted permease
MQIINKITPIILLLAFGKWIQLINLVSEQSIADIKKIIINMALPAILFSSFITIDIQINYIWFIPVIFGYCVLLYYFGIFLYHRLDVKGSYFPFLITGFEYGMLGVSLFGAAYGLDRIGEFAVVDFGQEMFIWFLYVAWLSKKHEGNSNTGELLKKFVSSPVIIAIFSSILLNMLGFHEKLDSIPFINGLLTSVELLSSLTVPLILLVVGYGIRIEMSEFYYSARVILIRLAINIPTALLINRFFVEGLLGLDKTFQAAVFTLLILPPPFILSLYMKQDLKDERFRVDNTLTLHSLATIVVFIIYYSLNSKL